MSQVKGQVMLLNRWVDKATDGTQSKSQLAGSALMATIDGNIDGDKSQCQRRQWPVTGRHVAAAFHHTVTSYPSDHQNQFPFDKFQQKSIFLVYISVLKVRICPDFDFFKVEISQHLMIRSKFRFIKVQICPDFDF